MSRLEEIKRESKQYGKLADPPIFFREVDEEDFKWLIQQAEHAEELEAEKETLMAAHQNTQREMTLLKNELDRFIRRAEKQGERIRELEEKNNKLEEINTFMGYSTQEIIRHSESKDEVINSYEKALKYYGYEQGMNDGLIARRALEESE